ncbi:MAG TPA: phytanoyl-CoA dioxygenase family protein [Tahibacter sp.]|uniref:phytanoyl-CoA dioxygenase family protein n=1 Tax=Tahibacter sp. TaxID=2056211 RepID=UPI002BFA02AF|nr:phytanoyl-CoA dioxygenase family protein [Tahibacter sp.]HSX62262.1 phytanoyl-CoA dioxygenase family protein [Tahibacter sp.]
MESPFFETILPTLGFDDETERVARDLNRDGFAVFRFDDAALEQRAERIKAHLGGLFDAVGWRRDEWPLGVGRRYFDFWRHDADVAAIAANQTVIRLLGDLYGRSAFPFQTLNFPVGSQQHYHSDAVHFSSVPERFMCGVWLALEDVHEDAGPLVYYPGSHRWPIVYNDQIGVRIAGTTTSRDQTMYEPYWRAMVETSGARPRHFLPKKGEALIWSANLLHGGAPQRDPTRTRWSQVTHYFFADCCYTTPMLSDTAIGRPFVREMVDIASGRHVPNVYVDVPLSDVERLAADPAPPPDFDADRYLALNPDVAAAVARRATTAIDHYRLHGVKEGRRYR